MGNLFDDAAADLKKKREEGLTEEVKKLDAIRAAALNLANNLNNSRYLKDHHHDVTVEILPKETVVIKQNNKTLRVSAIEADKFVSRDSSFPFEGDAKTAAKGIINWIETP